MLRTSFERTSLTGGSTLRERLEAAKLPTTSDGLAWWIIGWMNDHPQGLSGLACFSVEFDGYRWCWKATDYPRDEHVEAYGETPTEAMANWALVRKEAIPDAPR